MFGASCGRTGGSAIAGLSRAVANLDQQVDDSVRIDRIRQLEELKATIAAAQARETAAFVDSQRTAQAAAGVPAERVGRGISAQVALARRISPHQATRYVGWAKILTTELPHTYAALAAGRVPEWRALIVARETIWLSREHRRSVDTHLAPRLEQLGDRQVEAETKKLGYTLDPAGYTARLSAVENDRHVSLRPAPDCMTRLTALLPLVQGVAAYAALNTAADSARAAGDERGRGQVMADTLVQRLTGHATASDVPLTVNLVMTDQTLFRTGGGSDEPADVVADGVPAMTVPADLARRAARDATGESGLFLRRLYTRPDTGQLAAMDAKHRRFPDPLRHFLLVRDQTCRTPWCGAPIRHADHIQPADAGGPTSIDNGQGLCEACNHTKQAAGWHQRKHADMIVTITPTGHTYSSHPPRPPGWQPRTSPVEHRFRQLLVA